VFSKIKKNFSNIKYKKKERNERTAVVTNKLVQVKGELRSFTNLHGFSNVLNTSNPFVKGLWILFFLILFSGCIQNSLENINDYYQYTVITKIEYVNEYPMKLPAVTLCFATLKGNSTNLTLEKTLYNCSISGTQCDSKDFYSFESRASYNNGLINCNVLNGGRNSTGHSSEIKSIRTTGIYSGFSFMFYLPKDHFLFYFINDAFVKPTTSENTNFILPGAMNIFILEKTVETKLEYPFNNCWERINLPDTSLVRNLSEANITYRQLNCFELCLRTYVQNYALEHEVSEVVKRKDERENCNRLCPLECESTQYKVSESKFYSNDFSNTEDYSSEVDSLKYTKISQSPKTSLSALISNLGGSSGLFLDLSFMSACRAIEFFLGIVFKF